MDYPERVETERLLLRRWEPSDVAAMRAIWADDEVWMALGGLPRGDRIEIADRSLERRIANWEEDGFGLWAVVPRGHHEAVGWAGAWRQDVAPSLLGEIELGWTLRRGWWDRGLASEAARASLATAAEHIAPPRVISLIAPPNERSARVSEKLGMEPVSEVASRDGNPLRVFALDLPAEG